MCGRYTLVRGEHAQDRFGFVDFHERRIQPMSWPPRYNVAPQQLVPVIVQDRDGRRHLEVMRWGFVPDWARGRARIGPQINARAETLAEKPFFRGAIRYHRCLIPADGFYEWQARPGGKQPIHIRLRQGDLFAFAGLYAPGDDDHEPTCAIVTTSANELMAPIHARMPAILAPEDEATWLDPEETRTIAALACIESYPADQMEAYQVAPL